MLTLGIISLVFPMLGIVLGIAAWVMGSKDLKKLRKGQMDPQGQGTTQAGLICGIVGLVMQSLFTLACVVPYIMLIAFAVTAARAPVRVAPVPVAPATKIVPAGENLEMNEDVEVVDPNQPCRKCRRRGRAARNRTKGTSYPRNMPTLRAYGNSPPASRIGATSPSGFSGQSSLVVKLCNTLAATSMRSSSPVQTFSQSRSGHSKGTRYPPLTELRKKMRA